VLTRSDHAGKVYELAGAEAFTLGEYAEELAKASGRQVVYQDMLFDEYVSALVPEGFPQLLADSDRGIARDELFTSRTI
jgi:NAD(P)H dehydrogenase (quinone)